MKLRFHVFSNHTVSASLELLYSGTFENGGWNITGKSEKISLGYNIFDTEFYNKELKDIISQITTVDDLYFLNTLHKIPTPNVLYPDIDSKNKGMRSDDMGLKHRNDMKFSEKLSLYKANRSDFQQTYVYDCKNETDVALAELHYYITHGYKIAHCELCGKPFYTTNLKNKYCLRKGFDAVHPEYSCNKIRSLQRNTKCASNETKRLRKIILSTLARVGADSDYSNSKLLAFKEDDFKYKNSHLPSEYEQWIIDMYKKFVPNGNKLEAPDTI